jgi:uncharacterized protein (UPF0264 family)
LLVSVRSPDEARSAIEGGAEIIDIKEPGRGSLGKADDRVIAEIARTVRELDQALPISAALGELHEWGGADWIPRLPKEIGYVKLGLSRLAHDRGWKDKWRRFRDQWELSNPHSPAWVMVAYADWDAADSPARSELIDAARPLGCRAVLLDTFLKDGRSLVDFLSPSELTTIQAEVDRRELPLALAGGLRMETLSSLRFMSPAIVAIRSAACQAGNREGSISPVAVRQFRDTLKTVLPCFILNEFPVDPVS